MKIDIKNDLWHYLSSTDKKIVMYGMGNGADKILAICDKYGIGIADFFASDGFVRGHSFHGKTVLSYSAVKEKYGADNIIVLISFASSLPNVLALFDKVDSECETYAPDVPVCGETLFDMDFFNAHRTELEEVYARLSDSISRNIFENVILYKLSGRLSYLREAVSDRDETFRLIGDIRSAADLGAYNGDTAKELIERYPHIEKIYALEPDRRSYRKLSEYAETQPEGRIIPINAAAWSESTTLTFADGGSRNSGAFAKGKRIEVSAISLDEVLSGKAVDYIKYDVEGAEKEAIEGSSETIRRYSPALSVSVYHRSEDIFALPLAILKIKPDYELYLRRRPYVPAWDLDLLSFSKESRQRKLQ